ncbi:MAG: hypothetical protein ACFWT5_13330 [Pseudomonas helleri]|jgi:hypothetical protein
MEAVGWFSGSFSMCRELWISGELHGRWLLPGERLMVGTIAQRERCTQGGDDHSFSAGSAAAGLAPSTTDSMR